MGTRDALVFRAIADETRRAMLVDLAQSEATATHLGERFGISRPAAVKHLQLLQRAKLVAERKVGRERFYTLDQEPLREVLAWVASLEEFWAQRLVTLGQHLDENP